MENAQCQSADDVTTALKRVPGKLKGHDDTFVIELQMLAMMSGAEAETRIKAKIKSLLPDGKSEKDIRHVIGSLAGLVSSDGYKYLPVPSQSAIKFAEKIVTAVDCGTTSKLTLNNVTAFFAELWQSMSLFLSVRGQANDEAEEKLCFGGEAVLAYLHKHANKDKKKKKELEEALPEDCAVLRKFEFACPPASKAALKALLSKDSSSSGGAAGSAPKAKAKAKVAPPKELEPAMSAAAGMFA